MSKVESIISSKWTTEMSIGIQFSEALFLTIVKRYPNDKDLGKFIRTFILDRTKDNPYTEDIDMLATEIFKEYNKNK